MNALCKVFFFFFFKAEIDCAAGGNEYGQCGEEPERKDDRPVRRDIVIPQRCVPKLSVRQVI